VQKPIFTASSVARDLALLGLIAWLTAGPAAQSLGDIARRSTARPSGSVRSYTDADVKPARPVESAPAPAPAPDPAAREKTEPAEADQDAPARAAAAPDAPATAAPRPLTGEQVKSLQEQATRESKFSEELGARLQQRQNRVLELRKELKDLQRAHEAGDPKATIAARDALQQSLAEAERQLASAQRAVARAEARSRDAAAEAAQVSKP
jgi:hypothetical protein